MFSLQRPFTEANGLIEVAVGTKLENEIDMVLCLKRFEQIDNIRMRPDAKVDVELFGALIDSKARRAMVSGIGLGDDFDSNKFIGYKVSGLEYQSKRAMIERGDGLIPSIEHNAVVKLIAHTIHGDGSWTKMGRLAEGNTKVRPDGRA
jgi:hypothetical protein